MYYNTLTDMDTTTTKRPVGRPKVRDAFRKDRQVKFYASKTYTAKLDAMSSKTGKTKGEILRELLANAEY